jgi:LPS-assembly lipoprotein
VRLCPGLRAGRGRRRAGWENPRHRARQPRRISAYPRDRDAIDRSNVAARANLIGRIRYTLTDLETEEVMDSDEVSNFTGYSTFGTPVATQAAERDAEARLMQMLADQMLTRLAAAAGMPPE